MSNRGELAARCDRGRDVQGYSLWAAALVVLLVGTLISATSSFAQDAEDAQDAEEAEGGEAVSESGAKSRRDRNEEVGWMPSLAISWGIYSQSIDGTTSSTESIFAPGTGDSLITTMFQFEGKVHTPFQLDVASKPRLFLTAGVQIPLADELIAERIDESFDRGRPGFDQNCPDTIPGPTPPPIANPGLNASTCSLKIRNRVTIDAMWYAGLGVDFTLPILDSQFHIAPAVEYYGLSAHTVGDFERSSSGLNLDDLVETANSVGNSEIYHGISSSLTMSVDLLENGPWRWSMFLQGRVVFLLTDPFTSTRSTTGTNEILFVSDLDDFVAQGTGGIQLQWTGKR